MPSRLSPRTPPSRRLLAGVAALLASGLLLAACGDDTTTSTPSGSASAGASSAAPSTSASGSPSASTSVKASTTLDAITVTGAFGKTPKVKIAKTPWAIDRTRTKVLSPGTGDKITASDSVLVDYHGVDGRTGKVFDTSFKSGGNPVEFPLNQVIAGFSKGLVGQQAGSRVVIAMPGKDGYDSSGGQTDAGINVGDTLIFVVDIISVPENYTKALSVPTGTTVKPKAGLPAVTGTLTAPKVATGSGKAPSTVVVEQLIKGKGKQVTQNDTITFRYTWQTWTGKAIESNYGQDAAQTPVGGLVGGLSTALVGQPIGSRVLVVVPFATAYPDGNQPDGIKKTDTMVFLVDILFSTTG